MHEFLHKIFMAHEYNITQYTISSPLFPASWYYPHIFPRLHKSKRSLGRCWPFHTDRVWYIGSSSIKGTGLVNGFLDAMKKARVPLYPSLSSQSQTDHDLAEFSEHKHRERVASRHRKYPPDAGPWHVPTSSLNHIPQLRRSLAPWNSQRFPKVDTQRPKVQFWIRTAMDIQDDIIIQNKIQFAICRLELLSPNQVIKCSLACYLETKYPNANFLRSCMMFTFRGSTKVTEQFRSVK